MCRKKEIADLKHKASCINSNPSFILLVFPSFYPFRAPKIGPLGHVKEGHLQGCQHDSRSFTVINYHVLQTGILTKFCIVLLINLPYFILLWDGKTAEIKKFRVEPRINKYILELQMTYKSYEE